MPDNDNELCAYLSLGQMLAVPRALWIAHLQQSRMEAIDVRWWESQNERMGEDVARKRLTSMSKVGTRRTVAVRSL